MKDPSHLPILGNDTLQCGPLSDEVQQKLNELYRKGHSSTTACILLQLDLLFESLDGHCDSSLSSTICNKQYPKLFDTKCDHLAGKDTWFRDLIKCCEEYNSMAHEGKASVFLKSGHIVVAVCTPVMQRAHLLIEQAKDVMFIRTVTQKQKPNTTVYCLTTTSTVGDIPLGCVITDTENKDVFAAGLNAYRTVLPIEAFFNQGYPTFIMANEKLKDTLANAFPNSILLTNQTCILRDVWNWLWDTKNGIDPFDRQELFQAFKAAMLSGDEEELFEKFQHSIIKRLNMLRKYDNLISYFSVLWDKREDWASAYRNLMLPCTFGTNVNVDVVQRIVSSYIMQQAEYFNITQMFDFMVVQYESFMQKCLANCTDGEFIISLLRTCLPQKGGIDIVLILELQKLLYQVPSETDSFTTFTVDLDVGICSCEEGYNGNVCQHQAAVIDKFKLSVLACVVPEEDLQAKCNVDTADVNGGCLATPLAKDEVLPTTEDFLPITLPSSITNEINVPLTTIVKDSASKMADPQPPIVQMISENGASSTLQSNFSVVVIEAEENHSANENEITDAENLAKQLYAKICFSIKKNPSIFVPAMKTLRKNLENLSSKDATFPVAMQEFGKSRVCEHRKRKRECDSNQLLTYTLPPNFLNSSLQLETPREDKPQSLQSVIQIPYSLISLSLNSPSSLVSNQPVTPPQIFSLEASNIMATSSASIILPTTQPIPVQITPSATSKPNSYILPTLSTSFTEPITMTLPVFRADSPEGTSVMTPNTSATNSSSTPPPGSEDSSSHVHMTGLKPSSSVPVTMN